MHSCWPCAAAEYSLHQPITSIQFTASSDQNKEPPGSLARRLWRAPKLQPKKPRSRSSPAAATAGAGGGGGAPAAEGAGHGGRSPLPPLCAERWWLLGVARREARRLPAQRWRMAGALLGEVEMLGRWWRRSTAPRIAGGGSGLRRARDGLCRAAAVPCCCDPAARRRAPSWEWLPGVASWPGGSRTGLLES